MIVNMVGTAHSH